MDLKKYIIGKELEDSILRIQDNGKISRKIIQSFEKYNIHYDPMIY